jgi:hypothetical protein
MSETFKHLENDPQGGSQQMIELLETFFMPFLLVLDGVLDKRLVRTRLAMSGGDHSLAQSPASLVAERIRIVSARL